MADSASLFRILSDEQVTRFYDDAAFTDLSQASEQIEAWENGYQHRRCIRWAITRKDDPTMHAHPLLDKASLGKIGVWEDAGRVVAVAHYEWHLGEAFFQFHPAYRHLRQEMLDYAEENLFGYTRKDERKHLRAYVNDNDPEFIELVRSRGYEKDPEEARPVAMFEIPKAFPTIDLPEGFRVKSLAEECNWAKVQ